MCILTSKREKLFDVFLIWEVIEMKTVFRYIPQEKEETLTFEIHEKTIFIKELEHLVEEYHQEKITVKDYQKKIEVSLTLSSILYIEYIDRKCFFYTHEKTYEKRTTLNFLLSELPKQFAQVSKNTLLNIQSVIEIKSSLVNGNLYCILENKEEILISRRFAKEFKQAIAHK